MNLVVYITQVPDTAARIKIGADERHIDEQDVTWVVNPYDEIAVEAALQIREAGEGTVTVIGVGPERIGTALRSCLALGCDGAIHLKTAEPVDDPLQQARLVADALGDHPCDLIFTGKQSVDDDTQAQGPMIATLLGIPCATEVTAIELQKPGPNAGLMTKSYNLALLGFFLCSIGNNQTGGKFFLPLQRLN